MLYLELITITINILKKAPQSYLNLNKTQIKVLFELRIISILSNSFLRHLRGCLRQNCLFKVKYPMCTFQL